MPSVALIDDDPEWLRFLARELERDGWQPTGFLSGREALACPGWTFQAAVVDYLMPGMSGLAVISALRAAGFSGPVVLLSAYLDGDAAAQARASGAHAVSKVDLVSLFRTMGVIAADLRSDVVRPSSVDQGTTRILA
jgi:CheY-like chemotaxis protein